MGLKYSKESAEKVVLNKYTGKEFWKRVLLQSPSNGTSPDNESVLAKLPAWKRYLLMAPPQKVDMYNAEIKEMEPETFQGFHSKFNRRFGEPSDDDDDESSSNNKKSSSNTPNKSFFSRLFTSPPRLFVTNAMSIAPLPPQMSQYYPPGIKDEGHVFSANFVAKPLSLMGRVDKSRSVLGTMSLALGRFKFILQGNSHHKKDIPMDYAAVAYASLGPSTSHVKLQSSENAVSVGHMQRITKTLSAGTEAIFFLKRNLRCVSVAARWLVGKGSGVLAGIYTLTPRGLNLSYTQRLSRYLRVSTELDVGKNEKKNGALETSVAAGWEYGVSDTVVRGRLSDDLTLETTFEESLGEDCSMALSAVMNIPKRTYNWGIELQINS